MNSDLKKAMLTAEQAREQLFAASQVAVRSDNSDWDFVEQIFSAIKEAEVLRRHISEILEIPVRLMPVSSDRMMATKKDYEGYPRYLLRDDGAIVRIGHGSTGRYEHVVKNNDFCTIIGALNDFAESPGFSIDAVLKKLNLPSYLTYSVVALLKDHLGFLESPKRGQYKFRDHTMLQPANIIERLKEESHPR